MPSLSYKERFVEPVLAGLRGDPDGKRQSIRAYRKRRFKVGDTLYHYFAQRSKWCKKLGESICTEELTIRITSKYIRLYTGRQSHGFLPGGDYGAHKEFYEFNDKDELDLFARKDGFTDWQDMIAFWKSEHGKKKKKKSPFPFVGQLVKW